MRFCPHAYLGVIGTRSVVRLQPREEPFEKAVDAFRAAQFDVCLSALHRRSTDEAVALRARALGRLGQAAAASVELAAVDLGRVHDPKLRGELELLHSASVAQSGKTLEGRQIFERARSSVFASGCTELVFEFEFYEALADWNVGNFDESRAKLLSSLRSLNAPSDPSYALSLGVVRARSIQLLSNIHAVSEQYEEQARLLHEALDEYDQAAKPDLYTESFILMNYSSIVRELGVADSESIRSRYRKMAWTPFLWPHAFHIMRSFGWFNALRGDHLGAFRDLREAGTIAKTPTLELMAILDRAMLAQGLDEQLTARDELERAQDIAARIDWNEVSTDVRIGLLMLAQALAKVRPRAARVALDRYQGITSKLSTAQIAHFDRRLKADEFFTVGVVTKAEGDKSAAIEALVAAFDIWAAIGYSWRAALAAIELADLTQDSRYSGFAAAEAMKHPASWLAKRIPGSDALTRF